VRSLRELPAALPRQGGGLRDVVHLEPEAEAERDLVGPRGVAEGGERGAMRPDAAVEHAGQLDGGVVGARLVVH